ncbi:flavin-dependent halogenase family protein [Abortiporus biennis]
MILAEDLSFGTGPSVFCDYIRCICHDETVMQMYFILHCLSDFSLTMLVGSNATPQEIIGFRPNIPPVQLVLSSDISGVQIQAICFSKLISSPVQDLKHEGENPLILVVGGGPSGSYAATALAREGFDVTVLESSQFPRYHIGESLLPSVRPFLNFIDAEKKVKQHGFTQKPGGAAKLNQFKREGYTDFVALDPESGSWHVIRSEFDDLLLKHAECTGAKVYQRTKVTQIHFAPDGRPISASFSRSTPSREAIQGEITFDYIIDASGRSSILATSTNSPLKSVINRKFNQSLKNIAIWSYWENVGRYAEGTKKEGAIWIEALTDESGWVWYIPLHDGSTSIGIVMNEACNALKRDASSLLLQDYYTQQINLLAPGTVKLIGEKGRIRKGDVVRMASDYSYSSENYAGKGWRLAGDAAAFIDPFFSSGVHLAFTGGLSAAISLAASIRGDLCESDACKWHDEKFRVSYTRFLLVVLGVYKQIRNQSQPVLSDVGEDNFDRAFDSIRPVIQGTADVGKTVTEDELESAMDLVMHVFGPTNPYMQQCVFARIDSSLLAPDAPVITPKSLHKMFPTDEEAQIVLANINAWKPLRPLLQPPENFIQEVHCGYVARMERGRVGLEKVVEGKGQVIRILDKKWSDTLQRPDIPDHGETQRGHVASFFISTSRKPAHSDPSTMQSELKGWTRLAQMLRDYDSVRIKDCKEDIDTLLVFAVNHTVGWITTALTQLYSASFRHHLSSLSISWKYVLPIYSLDVPIRIRRFFSTCGTVVTRLRRVVSFPHSHSVAPIDLVSEERLRNTNTAQADMLALIHTDQLLVEDSLLEHIENCLYDLGPSRTLQCFLSLLSHRLGTPVPLHDLSHISPIPYSKIRNVIHGLCRILNQLIDFSSQESVVEKFPHKLKRDPSSTSIWSTAEMHYCLVFLFRLPIPHRENQMISLSTRLLQYNHESAAAVLFAISSLDVTEVSTYPHLLATNNGMQNLVAGTSLIMNGWFPRTWPLPYPRPPSTNPILLLHSMLAITAQNLSPFPFDELQSYSPQFLGLQAQLLENIENSESWQHRSSGPPPISVFKSLKSFYEELQERAPCLVHEGLRVFLEEYNAEVNQIVRFA